MPPRDRMLQKKMGTGGAAQPRPKGGKGSDMTKLRPIRHLAIASDNPAKAAEFYKQNFGWTELKRFGLDPDKPDEAPRPSGVFMSDGTLNIAILKFADDQLLKGVDYTGLHHFGVVVEDVNEWMDLLMKQGCAQVPYEIPPGTHAEYKFRGPDGVVFDITGHQWDGSAPA